LQLGIVGSARQSAFEARNRDISALRETLKGLSLTPQQAQAVGLQLNHDGSRRSAYQILSYPDVTFEQLSSVWPELTDYAAPVVARVTADAVYSVYLDRQAAEIQAYRRDQSLKVPADLDLDAISGLSNELKLKLAAQRPADLAQAGRIEGMTPAALTLLAVHARKGRAAAFSTGST
jgi:tRNA uridine 5-carboxymethylaminomethyl modification enzyme